MIRFLYIAFFIICSTHFGYCQTVVLERQVIGASIMDGVHQGVRFSGTAGEVVTATGESGNLHFTQGFHQPKTIGPLRAKASAISPTCMSLPNASISIDSIWGCSPPYKVLWNTGDTTLSLHGIVAGSYFVTITTEFCQYFLEIEVADNPNPCPLVIYNAITPNDDGKNDAWPIPLIDLPYYQDNSVSIFNRWGAEVWSVSGYNNEDKIWKGENKNGKDLPSGTYFYLLETAGEIYKGYIELIR